MQNSLVHWRRRPLGADGFSLVEVVIAAGLLGTAIVGLAHLFALAARAATDASDMTYATILAGQKIEELQAATFLDSSEGIDFLDAHGGVIESWDAAHAAYARSWMVAGVPGHPTRGAIVTVIVSRDRRLRDVHRVPRRQGRHVRLVTIIARSAR